MGLSLIISILTDSSYYALGKLSTNLAQIKGMFYQQEQ